MEHTSHLIKRTRNGRKAVDLILLVSGLNIRVGTSDGFDNWKETETSVTFDSVKQAMAVYQKVCKSRYPNKTLTDAIMKPEK